MTPASVKDFRTFYANHVVRNAGSTSERLLAAFATVERERYLGPGPWHVAAGADNYVLTPSDDPRFVYQDVLVGLVPERGINNGEPQLHARCLDTCAPAEDDRVLHIGAGTGYYTAILAALVGPRGRVVAYEIDPELALRAQTNLAHLETVKVIASSAAFGTLPQSDVIYVSAGATHPPAAWLDALNVGGRLIFPWTSDEAFGCMLMIVRSSATSYGACAVSAARFYPCIGARNDASSQALLLALRTKSLGDIRSLRRGVEVDSTAWCVGEDWWLSTAPAEPTAQL